MGLSHSASFMLYGKNRKEDKCLDGALRYPEPTLAKSRHRALVALRYPELTLAKRKPATRVRRIAVPKEDRGTIGRPDVVARFQVRGCVRPLHRNANLTEGGKIIAVRNVIAELVAHGTTPHTGFRVAWYPRSDPFGYFSLVACVWPAEVDGPS